MKHLITGGAGYLGNAVAEMLLARGEEVRVLDVEVPSLNHRTEYWRGDVCDHDFVMAALRGVDVVHHMAAAVPLTKNEAEFRRVNVQGTLTVGACAVAAGVKHFVHTSSSAIYGVPLECPITEDTPLNPVEPYGRSKLEGEIRLRNLLDSTEVELTVIRPRTLVGAGRLGIFHTLFRWIEEGRNIYCIGDGRQLFQFLHPADFLSAYDKTMFCGGGVWNVGTDRFGTYREALENVIHHAKSRSRVVPLNPRLAILALRLLDKVGMSPLAPWHYLTSHHPFHFDLSRLQTTLWRARYSNDQMLTEAWDTFKTGPRVCGYSPHRSPLKERALGLLRRLS